MGFLPIELQRRLEDAEMTDVDYESLEEIMGKSYNEASFQEIDDAEEILRERSLGLI